MHSYSRNSEVGSMGVGTAVCMYDVVVKSHVRYLISWWVLAQNWSPKTAEVTELSELIEMLVWLWARMGPKNHVLDGRSRSAMGRDNFGSVLNDRVDVGPVECHRRLFVVISGTNLFSFVLSSRFTSWVVNFPVVVLLTFFADKIAVLFCFWKA